MFTDFQTWALTISVMILAACALLSYLGVTRH